MRLRGAWAEHDEVLASSPELWVECPAQVLLNERSDGRLVARFTEPSHSTDPGVARAVLFEWNPIAQRVQSVAVWTGADAERPPEWALVSQGRDY